MAKRTVRKPSPKKVRKAKKIVRKIRVAPRLPVRPPSLINETTIYPGSNLKKNWCVEKMMAQPGQQVHWRCDKPDFVILFPSTHNPLSGSNEVIGAYGEAVAQLRDNVTSGQVFQYCSLVWDNGAVYLVEGNSPPEMEIQ